MAMSVGDKGEDAPMSDINTTPLVDIMLVLLIIFLITIPVAARVAPVDLPRARNHPRVVQPRDVDVSVDRAGAVYWNELRLASRGDLVGRLRALARAQPDAEVHIRGDAHAKYADVGKVVNACRQAGIAKVGFVIQPPTRER